MSKSSPLLMKGENGLKKALGLLSNPIFDIVHSPPGFYLIIGIAFLLCFMFSGIVFGFVPLENVMIENGVHSNLCEDDTDNLSPTPSPTPNPTTSPAPTPSPSEACSAQLLKLYTMYTIATTLLNLLSLPSGFVVDHLGPRPSLLISLLLICSSFCIFALGGYTFAYTLMGCSGILVYMGLFYLADYNESKRGLVIGLIAGGFNSSAVTFLILEPMEAWGLSLEESFFIFAMVSAVMIVVVFLLFPRSNGKWEQKTETQRPLSIQVEGEVEVLKDVSLDEEETKKEGESKDPPLAHLTFLQQLLTLDNVLLVISLAFSNLFVLFYQSTIDQQLASMAPNKPSLTDAYTSLFFLLLPIVTAVGIVLTSGALTYSSVAAMAVGRVFLAIASFIILVPIVKVCYREFYFIFL